MPRLLISPDHLDDVERLAREAFPAECCGLLLGREAGGGTVRVGRLEPCANRAPEPSRRFTIAPEALLEAYRRARRRGERVVGTYHSHPHGAAVPSATDRQSAWPGASYLIVGLGEPGAPDRRSWRLEGRGFVEQELIVRRRAPGDGER